ncbi:MAG: YabP/YqfC family sporulation protein [Clostridia bacterium]|nr:YabP/YqfC family sporulation protein [Clostridia bacterium]
MNNSRHSVNLDSRSSLRVCAVDDVISFDENLVSLAVGDTVLEIGGEGLSVKNLSLENGELCVTGRIDSLVYFDGTPRKKRFGLFGK